MSKTAAMPDSSYDYCTAIFSKSTAFLAVRFDRDAYTRFSSCWSRLEKSTSWVLAFCMPQQPKTHSQKSIYSYYLLCGHGTSTPLATSQLRSSDKCNPSE